MERSLAHVFQPGQGCSISGVCICIFKKVCVSVFARVCVCVCVVWLNDVSGGWVGG